MRAETITAESARAIVDAAGELERFAKGPAAAAVGEQLAFVTALPRTSAAELVLKDARNFASSLRALDTRKVVLVPWRRENESVVRFALVRADAELAQAPAPSTTLQGLWEIAAVTAAGLVLWVVSPAAVLVGAGVYIVDAYAAYKLAEAKAAEGLATAQQTLSAAIAAAAARGDTKTVQALTAAMAQANRAAAASNPSWMDQILGTIRDAAAGAAGGFGAVALFLALLAFSRQRR